MTVRLTPSGRLEEGRAFRDRSLLRGVAWSGIAKVIAQATAWGSTLLVARLLLPDDYGVMGMATFCMGFVDLVTEFGISTVIVVRKEVDDGIVKELNSVSVLTGLIGTMVLSALAPLLGRFFHDKRLPLVIVVLSLTFVVKSFRSVPWGVLQRDLRFKRLAMYDTLQSIAIAGLSITLASLGFGYWTLVGASLAGATITTSVAVMRHPVGFRRPNFARLKPLLFFSGHLVGGRVAWYGYSNSDFLVAGKMLGSGPLGNYTLAWNLSHVTDKMSALVLQVTGPVFARVQDDLTELQRYVIRITEAMSLTILPLMIGLALVTRDFVPLIIGAKWDAMIFPLEVLSAYAGVTVLVPLLAQVLLVTGHARYNMRHNVLQFIVMPCMFVIGAYFGGVNGIVIAWIVGHPPLALRISRHTLRTIGLPATQYIREGLMPALVGCVLMACAVIGVRLAWRASPPTMLRLACEVLAGAVTYAAVLLLGYRDRIVAIRSFATQMARS